MKKSLLITTLLAAGSLSSMAVAPIELWGGSNNSKLSDAGPSTDYATPHYQPYGGDYGSGWTGAFGSIGSNHITQISNHNHKMKIDLGVDARYEFAFDVTFSNCSTSD